MSDTPVEIETIGTLRYAPAGSNSVNLYNVNGLEGQTLGQLVMAVCCQRAALDEQLAVVQMNRMNATATKMAATGCVLSQVVDAEGGTTWQTKIDIAGSDYEPEFVAADATLWDFLTKEVGVTGLPERLDTIADRLAAADIIKEAMDRLNRAAEEESVKLESTVSRRDVEYRTAASTVLGIGKSGLAIANAIN